MKSAFSRRLSFRLTRDTVLLAMLLGLILNLVQVGLDYLNASKAMNEDIGALLEISHSPASQIAYNLDARLAEELLDGLLEHPAIVDARITDPERRTLAAASRNSSGSTYRWLSDFLFEPSRFYSRALAVPQLDNIALGELSVTIDTYHYGTDFLNRAAYTMISGFIKSLVLSVMLLFVFYFILTKPMLRVITALRNVEPRMLEQVRVPVPQSHEEDEIGQMVSIINQHLDTTYSSLDQLRTAETAIKDYSGQLEQEVEDRTREISEKNEALQRGNRALVRAKEDAVRRARARASFLASMSHEIRTPLNGVLGMLSLALEGDLEPGQRNRLEIAQGAGESLLNLLNDILDISKVEAGKLNLETIPFSVREVVEECAALHSQQARRKGLQLVADIDPALPESFLGDPTRSRQVINNLLGNAIKFTDRGEVRVQARMAGDSLRLEIMDTGIGMSEDGLNHIFAPFSQAGTDTTRRFGGTGLGLTLCRQLVERMHGQIMVESEEKQGTHFTVLLPLPLDPGPALTEPLSLPEPVIRSGVFLAISHDHPHRLPVERQLKAWGVPVVDLVSAETPGRRETASVLMLDPTDAGLRRLATGWPESRVIWLEDINSRSNSKPLTLTLPLRRQALFNLLLAASGLTSTPDNETRSETPLLRSRSLNVLLVEDNRVNQIVASGILRKLGYAVDLAENGERALATLSQRDAGDYYDVVLMDCQMPVMDGYEATRRIREYPKLKNLPIIAVTANVMQRDRDDCLDAGMNDYITKPYNREGLRQVIERWAWERG